MSIVIENKIGVGQENNENDIRVLKTVLNRLGFYTPNFNEGVIGKTDKVFFEAIKNFQKQEMLFVDGQVTPKDKTIKRLNDELKNPDNFIIFKQYYIWRTVGDKDVRGSHAARNGRQFNWNIPPDGGHPGEDFGCRCWSEPIVPMQSKGLKVGLPNLLSAEELDAVHSSVSPLDVLGGGVAIMQAGRVFLASSARREGGKLVLNNVRKIVGSSARLLTSRFRNTKWIDKTPTSQIQHSFRRAKQFGVKDNYSKKTLKEFKRSIKNHIKSKDTIILKGSYRRQDVIHYYNPKTDLNVMRKPNGGFWSAWKLTDHQKINLLERGSL